MRLNVFHTLCKALKFCPVLINAKLLFSSEEPVKEEEKKEPNCVKIENGIAPNHGLVLGVFLSLFYSVI